MPTITGGFHQMLSYRQYKGVAEILRISSPSE